MADKKITIISETDDLSKRIVEVNAGLSKWLTQQSDYNFERDVLRLVKSEKKKKSYIYQYEILKGEYLCTIPPRRGLSDEKDANPRQWILRPVESGGMNDFAYC